MKLKVTSLVLEAQNTENVMHWPIKYKTALNIEGAGIFGCVCYISADYFYLPTSVFFFFLFQLLLLFRKLNLAPWPLGAVD